MSNINNFQGKGNFYINDNYNEVNILLNDNYLIEKSKDNYDVLKIQKSNKNIYLGSKYNMKREIEEFLNQFKHITNETIFIICGFASGEHIKELRKKYSENIIIVFEPIYDLKHYIEKLKWIKSDEKIILLYDNREYMDNVYIKYINVFNYKNVVISIYNKYDEIYGKEIQNFLKYTRDYFINTLFSHNTRMIESRQWFKNLLENLEYMVNGTPIGEYKNYFKDKPAIIISAGPSLDKNIDQLKLVDNNFVIFTGYRNIDGLIEKNIRPNFLSVIDASDELYRLGRKSISYTKNIPLLFFENTNNLVVKEHKGKKIFFTRNKMIKEILNNNIPDISLGGSVAHSITDMAILMGCNPIIFVGQDLAYTDNKSYSKFAENKDGSWKYDEVKRNDDVIVEAYGGGKVRTSLSLQVFINSFESIIRYNPNITFINATEGGARIHGTIEMPLIDALKKYGNQKIKFNPDFENVSLNMRKDSIKCLETVEKKCLSINELCRKAIKFTKKLNLLDEKKNANEVNRYFSLLDDIDKKIEKNYDKGSIIESLLYPVISEIMGNKIDNNSYKEILKENNRLYSGILKQLEYAVEYIKKIKERLKARSEVIINE